MVNKYGTFDKHAGDLIKLSPILIDFWHDVLGSAVA